MANYKNGEVPASALAPLDGQPEAFLRTDAAASWNRARKEIKAATGRDIRARGWNRSLAEQVRFFNLAYMPQASGGKDPRWWNGKRYVRRPNKAAAAIPGTSNHGWGIAVDVEDFGLENQWNSPWRAKAFPILAKHGWTDHSGRSIGEPWHIEYDPNKDKGGSTPTNPQSKGLFMYLTAQQEQAIYDALVGPNGSPQLQALMPFGQNLPTSVAQARGALQEILDRTAPVDRGTKVSLRQEIADTKTAVLDVQLALTNALPVLLNAEGADPDEIAASVVAAIPENLAEQVIKGLGEKLNS